MSDCTESPLFQIFVTLDRKFLSQPLGISFQKAKPTLKPEFEEQGIFLAPSTHFLVFIFRGKEKYGTSRTLFERLLVQQEAEVHQENLHRLMGGKKYQYTHGTTPAARQVQAHKHQYASMLTWQRTHLDVRQIIFSNTN